jgi:glycosyltransferase involved in cell wall biosynthesis
MKASSLHIFIADPHLQGGGQVRYISTLAAGLQASGHRVTIGCRPGSVLIEQTSQHAFSYDRFLFKGGLRPRAWIHDLRAARLLFRTQHPDIIHVNGSQDHWTMALANQASGHTIPLLRTRHNTYAVSPNPANVILNRQLTDFQIVVCDTVRKTLAQHPAFRADRLCSIHNGVDTDLYQRDEAARLRARQEFNCKPDDFVCGIVARLVPAKGHRFLFEAAALLKDEVPNLIILVFGQGVLENELTQLASDLGISSRVRFHGFRTDMQYCVQAFDIGAQPSIDCDTSSFSMKEQMAACIPVVASDYGGLHEIIDDGKEGFLVPHGTVEPLAWALKKLAQCPELGRQMGETARERVCREFSSATFVRRTVEVYLEVLQSFKKDNTKGRGK